MHHICKNIPLTVLAVFMAGCTESNLPVQQAELQPVAIKVCSEPMTRANGTFVEGSFVAGKRIGVFGYAYDEATWQKTLLPNFFDNQPMTLQQPTPPATSPWGLTYSPVRYWPVGGRKLALYAYYPYSDDATDIVPDVRYGLGHFTYTTPTTASAQTDFMVTPLLADLTGDGGTPNLQFYQTLACIEINVDISSSTTYKQIKEVKVTNLYTQGRFIPQIMNHDLSATPQSDDWRTEAWPVTHLTDREDMTVTGPLAEDASLDATAHSDFKLLVIPQQCIAGLTQIVLTLVKTDDTETTVVHDLADLWKAGCRYQYDFTPTP